jgi:hypothetical protein
MGLEFPISDFGFRRGEIMRLKRPFSTATLLLSGLFVLVSTAGPSSAQCRRCNVCPGGINGDLFGYYPTIWRPWPGVIITPIQEVIPAPAPSVVPAPSAMPMPSGPPKQPATPPKTLETPPKSSEKPLEQTSFPVLEQSGFPALEKPASRSEPQPYFAPPQ